jgi:hypothetical protein
VPTVSRSFSLRPQHVCNYTVTATTVGSTTFFDWSMTITTSGNNNQPYGTGTYNNGTISTNTGSAASAFVSGTSNAVQSFPYDYRGTVASGLRNRTYSFSGGRRSVAAGSGNYRFRMNVSMGSLIGSITNLDITISSGSAPVPAPTWNTTSLNTFGRVGDSFSTTVSANNASSYSINSGSLPPGLSLSTNGTISGTFSAGASQSYSFTVRAVNSAGVGTNSNTFTITRFQALPTWADNTLNTTNLRVGDFFADSVAANNATSYSVSGLPQGGLSFSNGTVSGTPTSTASFSFTISAFNDDGNGISASYTFTPKAALANWFDNTLATTTVRVGQAYSDGVSASNASSYGLNSGTLPPGITLNTNSGVLSGTPTTAGSYSFVLRATNASNESITTATLSITVQPGGSGKVWNGSSWVAAPFKVWNGSSWVEAQAKVWNGSSWADPTA